MPRGTNKATATPPKPSKLAREKSGQGGEGHKSEHRSNHAPPDLLQKCLNIFRDALQPGDSDSNTLQEVKGHLYNRDFATAFGKDEYLRVYASRWSPSRAVGYLEILIDIQEAILDALVTDEDGNQALRVTCIGGGAGAEVIALAGWLHLLRSHDISRSVQVYARCFDIAAWTDVVADLHKGTINPPELSKYASAAAKEANVALLSETQYNVEFEQLDILAVDERKAKSIFVDINLVTLMFTLNELYATSMPKTQKMLAALTANVQPGAHLLVVDSPGSYSTVSINGAEKRYPMQWLLDYTLVGTRKKSGKGPVWEKLVVDESRWFRLPQVLKYPIELENMRYQIHLYKRLVDSGDE